MLKNKYLKRAVAVLLLFSFMVSYLIPFHVSAEKEEHKVVRVGWFDSSFNYYDEYGRKCGIGYEYQRRISAYTGWTYKYVEDSWANLYDMLKKGDIDLLADVSYRPEREEYMLFPDLPMGTESYYIFVGIDNTEITIENPKSIDGKRIGVNKGSIQEGFLKDWAESNGVELDIVQLTGDEYESMKRVISGDIDGYASIFTYDSEERIMPVFRIGGSDYYYAVNKDRPDLLAELNMALAEIQDEDPYFNQKISEDRLYSARTNALLTPVQEEWVKEHGAIRIGYRDDYMPFCDKDNNTGELTGALKDYLVHAENKLSRSNVKFETIAYKSTEEALAALNAGEIDCVFPVYLSIFDAEKMGIRLTNPAMKTEMNAVMKKSNKTVLSSESEILFAINEGMRNIETFIKEEYPKSKTESYAGLDKCYKAVSEGKADCTLVSNYRIQAAEDTFKKYNLYSVPTGEAMSFSFAVREWDTELYFLLNKTALTTESEDMDAALASYIKYDYKVTFMDFLEDNWIIVVVAILVVFVIVVFLLVLKIKADKTAHEQRVLLEEAEEVADLKQTISSLLDNMPGMNFTKDADTGEYLACNQAFAEYAGKKEPSEVVGLKPEEIFDAERLRYFKEDDRVALSMDEPYVFFEEMTDKDGNCKQIRTTKLKYTDANGRQCLLGILLDVTDTFHINRGSVKSKEDYERERNSGIVFAHIAQALAHGYMALYYVDINSEEFIEYRSDEKTGSLVESKRGWHFFEVIQDETDRLVYSEDQDMVKKAMDRKALVAALDNNNNNAFMLTARLNGEEGPRYISINVNRMQDDDRFIILGILDVDEEVKQRNAATRIHEERTAYNRINALAGEFFCVFVVNPETSEYREISSTAYFNAIDRPRKGKDFYADARDVALTKLYPEDQNRFLLALTETNILGEVKEHGLFTLTYRLIIEDEPRYIQMKAAMVEEPDGPRLIVGYSDIDSQIRQEEDYSRRLAQARIEANIDALTGVKNRNAYRVYEERLNAQIEMNRAPEFAIVILDVNDLKKVNDTQGHKAGDQYLRDACKIICTTFKRSPVFRVGGDEFAVLSQGDDYARIDELIDIMNTHNDEAIRNGGIVIAVGMAKYDKEDRVAPVYERADRTMYENKKDLKARK
ncbi:diguanylate cyclase (GGDEF) domain-containing protein [Eubacterium ruminantium]|nr:diguanylate cyclase (GGDEF) domain-containing protein [Eubacterium ruminantium]